VLMSTERPVTFTNRNGCRLFGMLYLPEQSRGNGVGVVISVNAIKYRLGTFRLHVLLARKLCELGYTVFTFDPEGIGDSEGQFEYKLLSEHYYDIQTGKYNNDLADAIGFFCRECSVDSLIMFGLCGGAISVLTAAASDPRVAGLILLNIPLLVEDLNKLGQADESTMITSRESASGVLKEKMHRLVEWNFWRRFVRLEVNFKEEGRLVVRAISVLAAKSWASLRSVLFGKDDAIDWSKPVSAHRLFNFHFQRAFATAMAKNKRILFLFSEFDQWTWIFKSEFQDIVLVPGNRFERACRIELIEGANHIFSGRESQRKLEQRIVAWLTECFPGRVRSALAETVQELSSEEVK